MTSLYSFYRFGSHRIQKLCMPSQSSSPYSHCAEHPTQNLHVYSDIVFGCYRFAGVNYQLYIKMYIIIKIANGCWLEIWLWLWLRFWAELSEVNSIALNQRYRLSRIVVLKSVWYELRRGFYESVCVCVCFWKSYDRIQFGNAKIKGKSLRILFKNDDTVSPFYTTHYGVGRSFCLSFFRYVGILMLHKFCVIH